MAAKKVFRVLVGVDYRTAKGEPKRAEPGDVVDDLPSAAVGWLLEDRVVEPVTEEI